MASYQSGVIVDQLLWELIPTYLKFKLENESIQSCGIKTSPEGSKIDIEIFKIDSFSFQGIAFIIASFNAFVNSLSDKWEKFTYSVIDIVPVQGETKLYKYTFTTENYSNEDLARKKH